MTETRETPNLPVNYQEQLAKEAQAIASRIAAPSGDRIRFNSNRGFITPDGLEGETMEVVIVDFVSANLFFDSPYDKDNPQPPACFAIGPEPSLLVPSPNSPDKQADSCNVCPNNQFGSASNGKGKACKNTRLLAVLPAAGDPGTAPIWTVSVPPTSLKAFDGYVHDLALKYHTVPLSVVTEITMDQNVTYAAPRFKVLHPVATEALGAFMGRREEARERLLTEPDVSQYQPPKPVKGHTRRGV